jgi:hypothetical protein
MSTFRITTLQVGNIAAFIVAIAINALANTTIIGGNTTAQISNMYPTLITPAGYVFAIWGLIYTLLAAFVVYQALPSQRNKEFQTQISGFFILSCVFNVVWIFLWGSNLVVASLVPIFGLLFSLMAIYLRLRIGKTAASMKEKACVQLPFSVYFGWITVAAAANVAAALSSVGWVKWTADDAVWGILAGVILLAVTLTVLAARKDVSYGLVAVWAFVGIAVNQSEVPTIVYAAYSYAAILAVAIAAVVVRGRLQNSKQG